MIRHELNFSDLTTMLGKSCLNVNRKNSVIFGKCKVKHARKGNKPEVIIAKCTETDDRSDTFVVFKQEDNISSLADLNDLEEYT